MNSIFCSEDLQQLLHNKFLVVIGDSIQRAVYKDLVLLLQRNSLLQDRMLKSKGEDSHCGDQLIERSELTNKRSYREVRQYQTDYNLLRFYFVTRCYGDYVETILADLSKEPYPDVIIMNSCLWDVTRYGPSSFDEYQKNLQRLCRRLDEILPENCLFIWGTTPPVARKIKGGFMLPWMDFYQETLRWDVRVANFYAAQVFGDHGYDILDHHHNMVDLTHWRVADGVHWNGQAHRFMTQMILSHISMAWGIGFPRKASKLLKQTLAANYGKDDLNNNLNEPKRQFSGPTSRPSYVREPGPQACTGKASWPHHQRSASCVARIAPTSGHWTPQGQLWPVPQVNMVAAFQQQCMGPPVDNTAYLAQQLLPGLFQQVDTGLWMGGQAHAGGANEHPGPMRRRGKAGNRVNPY